MADLKVSGLMKVKSLKANFKEAYGCTLRVYHGVGFADDDKTLAAIRSKDAKGKGEFSATAAMLVGNFEKRFKDEFGIKVQVANKDNTALSDDKDTLSAAGKK
ncbi:MAG: hypothetical protein LBO69_01420 [Ignavibacteria bacterium]|jgi:hypothetical protein|nr:hypothetical protein [Ignavibacteria bacterium]